MACLNLLGKARPLEEYTALIDSMPEWERNNRRAWTDAITQVYTHDTHAHVLHDCMLLLLLPKMEAYPMLVKRLRM